MSSQTFNDTQLWECIIDDDSKAFAALYDRYWYSIYILSFSYLKDNQASEEIVHDIFFDIWRRRKTLKIEKFKQYFSVATKNRVYKHIRKIKNCPIVYISDYGNESLNYTENSGYERVKHSELEQLVNTHLKKLPQRCEEIFVLSRIQNLSNSEIADQLGISKRTVENQITTASKYLRLVLKSVATFIF